ncbi:MAG: HAD family hydrolase [Polyangiaceae bacterium]|nr:HAD family hydrolase [Polyangiaceae bacterium]
MHDAPIRAVSFDFGQTLASLDASMLLTKLVRRGMRADVGHLERALPVAWAAYDAAVRAGIAGHPWKLFMRTLLEEARCEPASAVDAAVDFLWDDQPTANLWRRPIAGMIELCRELKSDGMRIGILTNSEGRAAELVAELGWAGIFDTVVDSGRVGVEKPDPRIFAMMAEQLEHPQNEIVHVGDSLGADVKGAVRAGMRAVWFGGRAADAPEGVLVCAAATDLREALAALRAGT